MAGNRAKPSKRNAVIIAIVALLAVVAVASTVVFLKNRGTTEAFETENPDAQTSVEGTASNDDATQPGITIDPNAAQDGTGNDNLVNGNLPNAGNAGDDANPANIQPAEITETETTEEKSGTEGSYTSWEEENVIINPDSKISDKISAPATDEVTISKKAIVDGEEISEISRGSIITYVITVSSDKALNGIEVSDKIPDETAYVDESATGEFELVTYEDVVTGIRWTVDLEEDNNFTTEVSFDVEVSEDALGPIVNADAYANGIKLDEDDEVTTIISYAITYNGLEDAVIPFGNNPESYTAESDDITLRNPVKTGYRFIGWTGTDLEDKTMVVTIPTGSTGDREYTANWEARNYVVTLNGNGGGYPQFIPFIGYINIPITTKQVTFDSEYGTLTVPTRNGYTFKGWNTRSNGTGETITEESIVSIPRNHTLYAQWEINRYSITYSGLDGATVRPNPTSYTVRDTFRLNNPTKVGYNFRGWSGTGINGRSTLVTVPIGSTGDREYTANWEAKTVNITLDSNNGVLSNGRTTIRKQGKYDSKYETVLETPTKAGYTFIGWNTQSDGRGQWVNNNTIIKNENSHTLYAQWRIITYRISYNLAGGRVNGINPRTYTVLSDTITLINPTRNGYTFAGWTGTGLTEPTVNVTIPTGSTGDRTYTATWILKEYTLTYVDEDGNTVDAGNPATYNMNTPTFTLKNPTKEGYIFRGWTEKTDSPFPQRPNLNMRITRGSTGNRTFIAHFDAISINVTLNANGGTVKKYEWSRPTSSIINTVTFDSPYGTLQTPERKGYYFQGWKNEKGIIVENTSIVDIPRPHTLVAQWQGKEVTIILDDGSDNPTTITGNTGDTITLPTPDPRDGYTFDGWFLGDDKLPQDDEGNYYIVITPDMGEAGTVDVHQVWTPIVYSITYNGLEGATIENKPLTYTIETGFTVSDPTKDGYTFEGWTGSDLTEPTKGLTVAPGIFGDKEYTATWSHDVQDITLNTNNITVEVGKTEQIVATLIPEDATAEITFTSGNDEIATVDANGNVTGVAVGETTITVTAGGVTETVTVTVVPETIPATGIDVNKDTIELEVGETDQIVVTVEPGNSTDEVTFQSGDESVATVDEDGTVHAVGAGETTITITVGDITETVTVIVTEPETPPTPAPLPVFENNRVDISVKSNGGIGNLFDEDSKYVKVELKVKIKDAIKNAKKVKVTLKNPYIGEKTIESNSGEVTFNFNQKAPNRSYVNDYIIELEAINEDGVSVSSSKTIYLSAIYAYWGSTVGITRDNPGPNWFNEIFGTNISIVNVGLFTRLFPETIELNYN